MKNIFKKNAGSFAIAKLQTIIAIAIIAGFAFAACGGSPAPVSQAVTPQSVAWPVPQPAAQPDELDAGIRAASDYLNKQLTKGNKLMILNVQSDFPALSEYIIDELIANTVNDRVFSVVDRQQLNTIRAELDFQMSGEVDDKTAQALGRMAGAQIIISGAVSKIGDLYRLRVRALSVQSAQIEGQFNKNIPEGPTVTALINSKATGYGNSAAVASASSSGRQAVSAPAAQPAAPAKTQTPAPVAVPAQVTTPAPAPTPAPPPAPPPAPTYKVGDKGPAGGIIFYDKGNNTGGWRYLEASLADLGKAHWQSDLKDVNGTKDSIGSGRQNTQLIGDTSRAALLCQQYSLGGYQDWFLPSKAELDLMYINLKMKDLGGFSDGWYWSSTQYRPNTAWVQKFGEGEQRAGDGNSYDTGFKSNTYSVRACRQF